MRYVVIGVGAVGGTVGALLARAGQDVVLVGRSGPHLDALRSRGLTLGTPDETFTVRPPVAPGRGVGGRPGGEAVRLGVKWLDTAAVLEAWAGRPVAGAQAVAASSVPVFCLQNGVENERQAARRFAEVYGAAVQLPGELIGPGEIAAVGTPVPGIIEIGRYPAGTGEAGRRLAEDLAGAGFSASVTGQVMDAKHTKLLRNLRNAIVACCGPVRTDAARELAERATAEGEDCYRAAGISYADPGAAMSARAQAMTERPVNGRARGGSSMWQSLDRGSGSTEADFLNGEIVLLGRLHGVPAPVNEVLRLTVNDLAARHQPPGTVDPAALLRAAAGALLRPGAGGQLMTSLSVRRRG